MDPGPFPRPFSEEMAGQADGKALAWELQAIQVACWVLILVGVWLPWCDHKLGNVESQDGKSTFTMSFSQPVRSTTYGLDTYQGWVVLWLPLFSLTLGSFTAARGRAAALPQVCVGLVVCAVALHLIVRPHAIGNASALVASGGIFGALQDVSRKSGQTSVGDGLFLVLAGGGLFFVSSVFAALRGQAIRRK